jgi:hypothetical protein
MFLQKVLRTSLALVLVGGLASLSLAVLSTARSQSAQETAVGPDALEALARMGKTLSAKQFSFQSRTFRSYAGPNGELLHIAHATKTVYSRPDRLSVSGDRAASTWRFKASPSETGSHETRRWRETDSNSLSPGTMSSAHLGARATPTKAAGAKPRMASLASRARGE